MHDRDSSAIRIGIRAQRAGCTAPGQRRRCQASAARCSGGGCIASTADAATIVGRVGERERSKIAKILRLKMRGHRLLYQDYDLNEVMSMSSTHVAES